METAEKKKSASCSYSCMVKGQKYYNICKEAFTSPIAQKFFHTEELIDWIPTIMDYATQPYLDFIYFIVWYEIYFEDGHEPGNMPNFSK